MSSVIEWNCTELSEMFAEQELVYNYLSYSEKKPSLTMDLQNSSQLHFRVSWNSMFPSVIRVLTVFSLCAEHSHVLSCEMK